MPSVNIRRTSTFEVARTYLAVVLAANDMRLTDGQLNLAAFVATRGTPSSPPLMEEFITTYKSSRASVYNMLTKLRKLGILTKEGNKIKLNKHLSQDFTQPVQLKVNIWYPQTTESPQK